MQLSKNLFILLLAGLFVVVLIWSAIHPADRATWWLEVFPAIIAFFLLFFTRKKFPLTPLLYGLIFIHAIILLIGGHYTYAEVPVFNWLRDSFDLSRNYYDRLGHFAQGFVPALVARELLIRTSPLRSGKWLFAIIVLVCLGISAAYELIEFLAAVLLGQGAENFLGTQGDVWDTQKDMIMALMGAILALVGLGNYHDAQLRTMNESK